MRRNSCLSERKTAFSSVSFFLQNGEVFRLPNYIFRFLWEAFETGFLSKRSENLPGSIGRSREKTGAFGVDKSFSFEGCGSRPSRNLRFPLPHFPLTFRVQDTKAGRGEPHRAQISQRKNFFCASQKEQGNHPETTNFLTKKQILFISF